MRTILLFRITSLLFLVFSFLPRGKSQIVFCPKGATWNYSFKYIPVNIIYDFYLNEKVIYEKDSLIAGDSIKILNHKLYYLDCYNPTATRTFIKQKSDTIYFKNPRTQNTWQILYNFSATPGNGWQTTILNANNTFITYTFVVDSVSQVIHNGFNLKTLHLNTGTVTERYGASFMFPFLANANGCDGYWFREPLCYRDSVFGVYNFSEKSCSFGGAIPLNINEGYTESQIKIWPNPLEDFLYIDLDINQQENLVLQLINVDGKEVKNQYIQKKEKISLSNLSPGIYFLLISADKKIEYKTKIIKH